MSSPVAICVESAGDAGQALRKPLFILNPAASSGRAGKDWAALIEPGLRARGIDFEVQVTQYKGHATELVRAALRGSVEADAIVSIGGDGTHNEVVNGFFDEECNVIPHTARLMLFTRGTGQDGPRTLHMPQDVPALLDILQHGKDLPCDAARLTCYTAEKKKNSRIFFNECSVGLSSIVCQQVNAATKRRGHNLAFMMAFFKSLPSFKKIPMRFVVDGQDCGIFSPLLAAICNGKYFGGGLPIAPRSVMNDGILDVTILDNVGILETTFHINQLYKGAILEYPKTKSFSGRSIRVEVVDPWRNGHDNMPVECDGELPGFLPMQIDVVPACIAVRVASDFEPTTKLTATQK